MPLPLEDLGGIIPPPFHTLEYPNNENMLVLILSGCPAEMDGFLSFYNSLHHSAVFLILVRVTPQTDPRTFNQLQLMHPYVQFIQEGTEIKQIANQLRDSYQGQIPFYFFECTAGTVLHPKFWSILKSAKQGFSYKFQDEKGADYELLCDTATEVQDLKTVAFYADPSNNERKVNYIVSESLQMKARTQIQELVIDTTKVFSPLCVLGTKYMTDKSPYNALGHRHPYTGVYSMFLSSFRYQCTKLKMGEIGILGGSSVRMWRDYFPGAELHAFDVGQDLLDKLKDIPGVKTQYMNVNEPQQMNTIFSMVCADGRLFDILIEDTTHCLEHQLLVIREATKWIRPGGVLVIEDIFRDIPTARFQEAIDQISERVESAVMVTTEHRFRQSGPWNNDRMLFIWVR